MGIAINAYDYLNYSIYINKCECWSVHPSEILKPIKSSHLRVPYAGASNNNIAYIRITFFFQIFKRLEIARTEKMVFDI